MEWWQWLAASGAMGVLGGAITTYIKNRPAMKKVELEGEAALWAEVRLLKDEAAKERTNCDERITRLEDRHASALSELRTEMAGDVAILRHDRNNVMQALNYLLTRIKKIDHPELRDIAAEAEEMLARGQELIALEKGARKA